MLCEVRSPAPYFVNFVVQKDLKRFFKKEAARIAILVESCNGKSEHLRVDSSSIMPLKYFVMLLIACWVFSCAAGVRTNLSAALSGAHLRLSANNSRFHTSPPIFLNLNLVASKKYWCCVLMTSKFESSRKYCCVFWCTSWNLVDDSTGAAVFSKARNRVYM